MMKIKNITSLFLVVLITVIYQVKAEQEFYRDSESSEYQLEHRQIERRLSVSGRELAHWHIQSTPLYGNSTDLMYYYATVYFGSHRQP